MEKRKEKLIFFCFPDKFLLATTTGTQVQLNMQVFFNHALSCLLSPTSAFSGDNSFSVVQSAYFGGGSECLCRQLSNPLMSLDTLFLVMIGADIENIFKKYSLTTV